MEEGEGMAFRLSKGTLGAAGLAIVLCATAAAVAAASVTMKISKNTALGTTIVVSATGKTLYRYRDDSKNTVKCTGACATSWPPLLIAAGKKPVAGTGVTASKLGTMKRTDGKTQVTYGGYALYFFAGDKKAGEANGQGLEGEWHAVAPSGAIVTKAAASPAPAASGGPSSSTPGAGATTTTPASSGGSGYGY
jgi:predicted lipoprotein with Yx(FWY)xxD motif